MAALDPSERGHPPSIPETFAASPDLVRPRPSQLASFQTSRQTDAFQQGSPSLPNPLPSPRSGRSQSLAIQSSSALANAPIRRKPLSSTASPLATRYSTRDHLEILQPLDKPETRFSRSFSVDSPTIYEFPHHHRPSISSASRLDLGAIAGSQPSSPVSPVSEKGVAGHPGADAEGSQARNIPDTYPAALQTAPVRPQHDQLTATLSDRTTQGVDSGLWIAAEEKHNNNTNTSRMSLQARKPAPPHLTLAPQQYDTNVRATPVDSSNHSIVNDNNPTNINKPLPKSPASSKFGTFFGWGSSPSTTDFSDKGVSPLPSPLSTKPTTVFTADASPTSTKGFSAIRANASDSPLDYLDHLQTPPVGSTTTDEIDEMEDELKAISAELAASIRREMDLEDLVDRLQDQINNPQPGRRTSDYFSDSGYSSAKFSDYDQAKEEISQVQRRAEQEKAQIRLELSDKLQDERSRRKALDEQIQLLSQKAAQIDVAQLNSKDATGRVQELETACDDLRRRLSEERQVKDNFEDLLTALKGELQSAANERDNLRDEIVPQLRARVEGLEAEAADTAKMTYDTTKLQQELENLKAENVELKDSRNQPSSRGSIGLSRSASVAGGSYKKNRPTSLARSNTTKQTEPREILVERLKDVEAQRDALHSALRNLLDRQEYQNRENDKRIKALEVERDRLLSASPRKAGYEKEVLGLREEISVLRRRAEDAIEQKFQVEKGLSGLKMDLDRAEAEISSLRALLKEKDILIPASLARASGSSSSSSGPAMPVTSASLEKAYKELQAVYADALERIKTLELSTSSDERTKVAMERLEQSLSAAVSERNLARTERDSYKTQLESFQASEKVHLESEKDLAKQLEESARRVEELAAQVRSQLTANTTLRTRLTQTVSRGEADQRASKERIAGIEQRLRTLEEQLVSAQTAAEERIARHEEEVSSLKEAHHTQLQRLRPSSAGGLRSPRLFPPKSPLSPMLTANGAPRSPRLSPLGSPRSDRPGLRRASTTPSEPDGMAEQVTSLKGRVTELEGALAAADVEMQEVVSRMNMAQIEVLTLQEELDSAMRETRRLQKVIDDEKVRQFEDRFKTITTEVRS
ncbi:hypothetical protein GQ53DRAFT_661761 [Thozetella sp. PMI_491]|nr:hypothetical protein GQ53DRAFT_661761 [Thozetella sp. PMI_491]